MVCYDLNVVFTAESQSPARWENAETLFIFFAIYNPCSFGNTLSNTFRGGTKTCQESLKKARSQYPAQLDRCWALIPGMKSFLKWKKIRLY
jgi:hypothetical protein